MNPLENFTDSFNALVINSILKPIADHFKEKDIPITLEELISVLNLPVPQKGGCIYEATKGRNPGVRCGKPVLEGEEYCKTCFSKPRIANQRKQKAETKAPLLSSMPRSLLKKEEVTPLKSFISKPCPILQKDEVAPEEPKKEEEKKLEFSRPLKLGSLGTARIPILTLGN